MTHRTAGSKTLTMMEEAEYVVLGRCGRSEGENKVVV